MKEYTRKSKMTELEHYDHLAKEHDFIEITEWYNGEGFDVTISAMVDKQFSLTYGELEALNVLVNFKG